MRSENYKAAWNSVASEHDAGRVVDAAASAERMDRTIHDRAGLVDPVTLEKWGACRDAFRHLSRLGVIERV